MSDNEQAAIRQVIEDAYIKGIHGNQDEAVIKNGFHKDFEMLVRQDNAVDKVAMDLWLSRIETMKADNPKMWNAETTYEIHSIDVAGYAASAKLDVHKGDVHFSTDYMLLYKFEEGWRIVSKIFAIPS